MKTLKLNSRLRRAGPKPAPIPSDLKLDLGCGPNKKPGFTGVDWTAFPGVDAVCNLGARDRYWYFEENAIPGLIHDLNGPWPSLKNSGPLEWYLPDNSVSEVHCSHVLEHFDAMERVHFLNELFRVMKPGAKATVITPHWSSCRAYGDCTHKWPPVSEFLWYYLKKEWRMQQAPHTDQSNLKGGYSCNFEVTWGYTLHPEIASRNQEYQQYAMNFLKEATPDMIATLVKPA
jgi:hypothetical protein